MGAEIDGTGHTAIGVNVISFQGSMDAAILIQPGQGGHVVNGIEITADNPIVIHGTGTMPLIENPDTGTGIWQVNAAGPGQPADFHLIGAANMGTDHMHAGVIA